MNEFLKILHLEDVPEDALLVRYELEKAKMNFEKLDVDNKDAYVAALVKFNPDIILSDHSLPSFNSLEALEILKNSCLRVPFILITATISEEFAVTIMKAGAADYILKDRTQRLPSAIKNALEKHHAEIEKQNADYELTRLFNTIDEVFFSHDMVKHQLTQISPACKKIYGYTPEDFLNDAGLSKSLIYHDDLGMISGNTSRLEKGETVVTQYRIMHKTEGIRWVETKMIPTLSGEGQLVRFDGVTRDITDKKQAEQLIEQNNIRLKEAAETQSAILNALPPNIALLNEKGLIVTVNQSWKKFAEANGLAAEEYGIGQNYITIAHAASGMDAQIGKAIATGIKEVISGKKKEYSLEYPCHSPEEDRWFQAIVAPLTGKPNKGVVVAHINITDRKAQEEALKNSEANLSAIIENTTDLVYSLDTDLNIITFNERFKKSIKKAFNLDVHQGTSMTELLYTYDFQAADRWINIYKTALKGETLHFVSEHPSYRRKTYLSYSMNPIRQGGEVIGISCFLRDITKQKLDELSLIQSEANMRSVFENTDLYIILLDNNLKVVSYNSNAHHQAIRVFGKALVAGNSAFSYFPKERWPVVRSIVDQVKSGQTVDYETIYDLAEGGKNWFDVRWTGIFNDQKENLGLILTLKNITEKKNADLEREKISKDLLRRNQDLEQFTYIISHNLRAPVANIKGLADLLGYYEYPDDECVTTIAALSMAVNNLDRVIIDLNTLLQTGKQVNEKIEPVALSLLVDEIKAELKSIIDKNDASIICDFKDLAEVSTVKSYLYSIFQNLIVNGIKYRRSDHAPVIVIKTEKAKDQILIRFTDNGKGIDLEKFGQHLFGLYKRFDFTVEGKGMGLFMVKMQVEALGGKISVKSEVNNGTAFTVELPM